MTRTLGLRQTLPSVALALLLGCDGDPAPLRPADRGPNLLTVTPTSVDFPEVRVGDGRTADVVVTNGTSGSVTIDIVNIEGAGSDSFTARPDDTIKIGAGRSKKITVTFSPRRAGDISATMVLFHDVPKVDSLRIPLSGGGLVCVDRDMDGFGEGCTPGPDCNDSNANVHPGVTEVCDGADNNCNDEIDEGLATTTYHRDQDGDGYGTTDVPSITACQAPTGYVERSDDCDDGEASANPMGTELCTGGIDEDCDRLIDDLDPDCATDGGTFPDATSMSEDTGVDAGVDAGMVNPFCTMQDDCGLSSNRMACPLIGAPNAQCAPVCRHGSQCNAGFACRPLPGSASLGFCQAQTGTAAVGAACTMASQCADGVCVNGACRSMCQRQSDCAAGDECGFALYNTNEFGGGNARRLTTVCRPIAASTPIGGSCNIDAMNANSGLCATQHCDLTAWQAQATPTATCSPICSSSQDCSASQICGLVYNGLAETPNLPGTFESAGRYFEAILGCYSPYFFDGIRWNPQPPGAGAMGAACDPTRSSGRLACRSHVCAGFPPIRGQCTDYCKQDSECVSPSTPNWRCKFGELNLIGAFQQSFGIADPTRFVLVGICAP